MSQSTLYYQSCEDCVNCRVLEDRSEDMRPPTASCLKLYTIEIIGIMEFKPASGICPEFEEGEPEYL